MCLFSTPFLPFRLVAFFYFFLFSIIACAMGKAFVKKNLFLLPAQASPRWLNRTKPMTFVSQLLSGAAFTALISHFLISF